MSNQHPMNSVSSDDSDAPDEMDPELLVALNDYLNVIAANSPEQLAEWRNRNAALMPQLQAWLEGLQVLTELSPGLRRAAADSPEELLHVSPFSLAPMTLGDFKLTEVIGRGGMGVVYLAEQITLKRQVAVKILPLASAFDIRIQQRFQREAQAAAQLHHPHIVPVFTVGCQNGIHFYAMQLIQGRSLAMMIEQLRILRAANTLNTKSASDPDQSSWIQTAVRFGIDVADAVSYAHDNGVIHRDIKPANLLVDEAGKIFVADFGLAITQESGETSSSGPLIGTLRYASPEQVRGKRKEIDHRTDIYSLGATLYEMLTLSPPFPGDDYLSLTHEILKSSPTPLREINPAVPRDLETIVHKAMSAEREDRYLKAIDLAADLRRFAAGSPVEARRIGWGRTVYRSIRRNRQSRLILSVVALSVVAITLMTWIGVMTISGRSLGTTATTVKPLDSAVDGSTDPEASIRQPKPDPEAASRESTLAAAKYSETISLAQQRLKTLNAQQAAVFLEQSIPENGSADLRGFEWYALHDQCKTHASESPGHEGHVYWLTWSSDSTRIATASIDRTVRIWDVSTQGDSVKSPLHSMSLRGHSGEVSFAAFSPDEKQLASTSEDGTVRVWQLDQPGVFRELRGHDIAVVGAAFSPVGRFLVSADDRGQLFVWNPDSGELLSRTQAHPQRVHAIAFSSDGSSIATASDDSTVAVWNAEHLPELTERYRLTGHERAIHSVAWSHDGTKLLSGGWDKGLRLWKQGQPTTNVPVFRDKLAQIQSVSFSPDDSVAVCATFPGYVHQIDTQTAEIIDSLFMTGGRCWCAQYSPDGKWLAAAGESGKLIIWPADPLVRHRGESVSTERSIVDLQVSSDGRYLVSSEAPSKLTLRNAATGDVLFNFPGQHRVDMGFVLGDPGILFAVPADGNIEFWDLSDVNRPVLRPELSPGFRSGNLAISADRKFLSGYEQIPMNLKTRKFLVEPVTGVSVGGVPIIGSDYDCIPVFKYDSGHWWYPRDNHRILCKYLQETELVAFSPDGKTVYTGNDEGFIYQLQPGMPEPMQLPRSSGKRIHDLAMSPDGRTLATAELSDATDPNIVLNLRSKLDATGYYDEFEVNRVVEVELNPKSKQSELQAAVNPVTDRLVEQFAASKVAFREATEAKNDKAAQAAKDIMDSLLLLRTDMTTYQRAYAFLSQIFDYGNTDFEKRAIFFKHLLRLLKFGREREGIDLSQVMLTHLNLKNKGKQAMKLADGEYPKLAPLTEAGSGSVQEKEKAYLTDIIQKVNDLFKGELTDNDKLVYVNNVILGKLLESQTLIQQAVNTSKEQFANSPDLKNAIMAALDAHTPMSTQALDSEAVRDGLRDILLGPARLYETLRKQIV